MLKGTIKGMAMGGLAAYLIIGKGFHTLNRMIDKICDTAKWRSYYRYGKDGNMVPPGYSMRTQPVDGKETIIEKEDSSAQDKKQGTSSEGLGEALGKVILDTIKDKLKGTDEAEGASEGQREASEEDICPETDEEVPEKDKPSNYSAFLSYVHECNEKGMSEEDIAMSLGMEVSTLRKNISDAEDILSKPEEETMYADDLYDGVKAVDPEDNRKDEKDE